MLFYGDSGTAAFMGKKTEDCFGIHGTVCCLIDDTVVSDIKVAYYSRRGHIHV